MKIVVLAENTSSCPALRAEHGLSLYLEAGERKLLFDAGQSACFAENAARLGIDLAAVDTAILSHGHYDHGGGLPEFFRRNSQAICYANPKAFRSYYNAAGKYIGLDPTLREPGRMVEVAEPVSLGDGLMLFPGGETAPPTPSGMQVVTGGKMQADDFCHEQYLLAETGGKRILVSGCSHRGVENILERFRPDVFIGGFHTKDITDDKALDALAEKLAEFPAVYYTCHCTGQVQFGRMKKILGERLRYLGTGDSLIL